MDKKKWDKFIKYKFKLPKNANIVFYRHPKEFSFIEVEGINPTHKLIIWGKIRKKYSSSNSTHKIKLGRISIPIVMFMYTLNDKILNYFISHEFINSIVLYLLFSIFFTYCFIIYPSIYKQHPIIGLINNVNWYTRRSRYWKNIITN